MLRETDENERDPLGEPLLAASSDAAIDSNNTKHQNTKHQSPQSMEIDRNCDVVAGHHFAKKFGVGTSLYFKMLKLLSATFAAMGLLNTALLQAYISGDANINEADEVQGGGLESTSLANVVQTNQTLSWGALNQEQVFIALSYFDCVSICIFMATCLVLLQKQAACVDDDDLIQTTPSDYTVCVTNLPHDATDPLEIQRYFETLLKLYMRPEEVAEQFHVVAEVSVHHECLEVLERSAKIAVLFEQIGDYEEHVAGNGNHPNVGKLRKLKEQLANANVQQEDDLSRTKRAVCCFVTFENDEGKDRAVELFKAVKQGKKEISDNLLELSKFRSTLTPSVKRAHEPLDIKFENLEKTRAVVWAGRLISFLMTLVVLVLALVFVFAIKLEAKRLRPDTSGCAEDVDYTKAMAQLSDFNKECYCGISGFSDMAFCSEMFWGTLYR